MTTNNDPRTARIAALLATAESLAAQGNEEAANNYIAKASELQLKYMIEDSDIRKAGGVASDEYAHRTASGLQKGAAYIKAKRDMLYGLAQLFNVRTTIAHDRSVVIIYGFESDLDFVQQLFDSLSLQLDTAVARAGGDRSFKTSFAHGFATRVVLRLRASRASQEADAVMEAPGTALVLRDRRQAVAQAFDAQFAGRKFGKSYSNRSIRSGAGLMAGDAAGRVADIGGRKLDVPTRRAIGS